jgi:hypothetical protein
MRRLLVTLSAIALSTTASAQTIDAQGAAQLSESLSRYVSEAAFDNNIVNVVPDGDAYRIDIDFNAIAPLVPAGIPAKFSIAPYALRVKPRADGTWQVDAPLLPDGWLEAGEGRQRIRFEWAATDAKTTGVYDPELAAFASATGSYASMRFKTSSAASLDETSYGAGSITMSATKSASGGVDVSVRQEFGSMAETNSVRFPDTSIPFVATIKTAAVSMESTGTGVRTRSLLDLLAFGIANAGYEKVRANQAELKRLLLAALPVWDTTAGTYGLSRLEVITPVGILRARTIDSVVAMDGVRQDGKLSYGAQISDMEVASFFLPGWTSVLIPTQVDLDLTVTNLNLDEPARMLIGAFDLNQDPPVPANVGEEIAAGFEANPPRIIFPKSTIGNATVSVVAEGEMTFAEGKPIVDLTFDATGYDQVVGTLEAALPKDPRVEEVLRIARFLREEANTMPSGHLKWTFNVRADGQIELNSAVWPPSR